MRERIPTISRAICAGLIEVRKPAPGAPATPSISRAICAGLIEVRMRSVMRMSAFEFPAQFARASLKSHDGPSDNLSALQFPAQFARASLKSA